ncbi:MAG: hypothetical protein AB1757_06405 [Acidobacteriota bacterium]
MNNRMIEVMNNKILLSIILLFTLAHPFFAAPKNIKLKPTPQKSRAFYNADDSQIPATIRQGLAMPKSNAQSNNGNWRVEDDAFVRESPTKLRLSFKEGLPIGNLKTIAITTDGAVWAGGNEGLVRYQKALHPWDRWQYFAGKRYLPSDEVIALVAGEAGSIWARTSAGISHIEMRPMTLAQKAAYFEERIEKRHKRHGLVADSQFLESGNTATSHQYPNDNDGLWTAIYAAAECFRYAVTTDREALSSAKQSLEAMLRLESITGRSGYPARSFRHKDEPRHKDGFWYFTPDKEWEWKSDTSSDELVGHFFAYAIAYDLLPDVELKKKIQGIVQRITDHIIENQYYLIDVTGKPTRWGRWSPEYFADPDGHEDSPLNALELLSFCKVAHHITGEARFGREYRKLIDELGYHRIVTEYLERVKELNYSDEELAMLSFYPLMQYEKDARLLKFYREGMADWWVNIKREANPLWTFIYAASHPQKNSPLADAARTLYRIPMDLTKWSVRNMHRRDVTFAKELDRHNEQEILQLLAPDERRVMRWNSNPFQPDSKTDGRGEDDGAFFLLPYWMGRYHKLIVE